MSLEYFVQKNLPQIEKGALGRLALFCNQSSYCHSKNKYLFEILEETGHLDLILAPEHGLFAELQDQVSLNDASIYEAISKVRVLSLYQDSVASLRPSLNEISKLDTLVIDIQDVGSRYYTFATHLSYIFDLLSDARLTLKVLVIERINPASDLVEGIPLSKEYQSFVGRVGLPHRHGLTIGELANFYKEQSPGPYQLEVIYDPKKNYFPLSKLGLTSSGIFHDILETSAIYPSPNMPNSITPLVYSGQCLLEGTNISEGRGTTRPFEIFGAGYLKHSKEVPKQSGAYLRPLYFLPTFHKFANERCFGYQIHLDLDRPYHSLAHSLKIIRWIRENNPKDFAWHSGVYEFYSEKPAIEILLGDKTLLDYLNGEVAFLNVREKLTHYENEWIKTSRQYHIHQRNVKLTSLNALEDFA